MLTVLKNTFFWGGGHKIWLFTSFSLFLGEESMRKNPLGALFGLFYA